LRPGERHIAQVLWPANDPDARVAIHQFPFLASRFTDLDALLATFAERGEEGCTGGHRGTYFHLDADGASEAAWNAAAGILDELADFRAAHAGAEASFARRLRDARPSFSPREVDDRALAVLLRRAERLVQCLDDGDDDPETCDEGDLLAGIDLEAIREGWELERAAFERLDDYLGLDRHRQPFPEVAELSAVRRGRVPRGFLLELPEPLDWERIAVLAVTLDGAVLDLLAVKDAAGARIFLIPIAGGAIGELDEGLYRIEMTFQGELAGWRAPALQRAGGAEPANVTAAICFELGRDLHVP
jgi:hypothetical protein